MNIDQTLNFDKMNSRFDIWKYSVGILIFILLQAFNLSNNTSIKDLNHFNDKRFFAPPPGQNQNLSCGYAHTLAIKADSTLWAWGNNSQGQLGNGSLGNAWYPIQVNGITGITDAAGGYEHTIALKSNGTVSSWGRNSEGQLGDGTLLQRTTPVIVGGGLANVVNIGAGYYHSLAIKGDGSIWSWGQNNYGQLGNGTTFNSVAAIQVLNITGMIDVVGGEGHTIGLKNDGTVWTWGRNSEGQLGDGTIIQRNAPVLVSGINATAIAAGRYHSLALKSDGTVWTFGYNNYGQLGNGNTTNRNIPVQVNGLTNVVSIAAGEFHSIAIKNDGSVWAWGYNGEGQLGNGTVDVSSHSVPIQIGNLTSGIKVSAGKHSILIKIDNTVWAWGNNVQGMFGNGSNMNASTPQLSVFNFNDSSPIALPAMSPDAGAYITSPNITISCSTPGAIIHYTTNGIDPTENDAVIGSGSVLNAPIGITIFKVRAFKAGFLPGDIKTAVYQVGEKSISGYTHSIAIRGSGDLWTWGNNNKGQIGNGLTVQRIIPLKINTLNSITDAAGGFEHTLALKSNGTVYAWGRNSEGQLGDGTFTQRTSPLLVRGLSNIINVEAGYYHSLAIKNDGSLCAWGNNDKGQLGNGTTFNSIAAQRVGNLSGIIDVKAGEGHTVALKNDGTAWVWGRNSEGQLGDGTTTQRNSPIKLNGINAIAIAAGRHHTLVLSSNGTVWAFGYNNNGQLGNGNTTNQIFPVAVNGLSNIVAIAAGEYYSLAIKNDGTVWGWGDNTQGQLGNGTFTDQYIAVQVSGLGFVSSLSAGNQTLFVTPLAGIHLYWATGNNSNGQVGDSTLINKNARVLVHFAIDQNNNGISDWNEYKDPVSADSDKDGLPDWTELFIYGTDPLNFDSNGDGLADGVNVFIGFNPKLIDTDGDGISNAQEILNGTSPILADSDSDGVPDNLDPFPMDRFRKTLPPVNPADHTPPVIILSEPF